MRKLMFWLILLFSSMPVLRSQVIYLSSLDRTLLRIDIATCQLAYVTQTSEKLFDITFHPDGSLYGITPDGELMRVDTNSGSLTEVYDFNGTNFNSLTASADGIIYAIGSEGYLWSYHPASMTASYLGNVGFPAAGDLTFRQGVLYMAASDDRIVRIPLEDPGNSRVAMFSTIQKDIFGIVSYAADCENITSYAITNGRSEIYAIDFTTGTLTPVCNLNVEISGGASSYEFMGSNEMVISIHSRTPSTCFNRSGTIEFAVTGGSGILQFSLDAINYSHVSAFDGLASGAYTLYVVDSVGCRISYPFIIHNADGPQINTVVVTNETCQADNGAITLWASGGTSPLQYTLDGGPSQSTPGFSNLTGGSYTIEVTDQHGCKSDTTVQLISIAPSTFTHIDVIDTRCDSSNGAVMIQGAAGAPPFTFSIPGIASQSGNAFQHLSAGSYFASLIDRYGCEFNMPFTIQPSATVQIEDVIISHAMCGGSNGTATAIALNQSQPYQYSIDGSTYQLSPTFTELPGGDYTVYMQDFDGCVASRSFSISESLSLELETLTLKSASCGETDGSLTFEVNYAALPITATLNTLLPNEGHSFKNLEAGEYLLHIEDAIGCTIDSVILISAEKCPLYIPNVFSPNNDGQNDYFSISSFFGVDLQIRSYRIYDRWGSLVYSVDDFPLHLGDNYWWDGTVGGQPAPGGVYAYHVMIEYGDGDTNVFTGDVTIVR